MCLFCFVLCVAPSVRWQQPVYGGAQIKCKKKTDIYSILYAKIAETQNANKMQKGLRFICKYNNSEIEIEMQIKTINKNANMSIKVKCKFVSCFECSQKKNTIKIHIIETPERNKENQIRLGVPSEGNRFAENAFPSERSD